MAFHLTIGLGAFLLFLVQPLAARQILPWFGGGPLVWSACMVFFQIALVFGYLYAHLTRRLGPRRQVWLHLALLALALATLPIAPSPDWKPPDGSQPVLRVIALLGAMVGVPFILLAATAPLVQDWFAATVPARSPYRLYVVSNAGSLLALLAYPILIEPTLSMPAQAAVWSAGFVLFVVACAWTARRLLRARVPRSATEPTGRTSPADESPASPTGPARLAFWLVLPATSSGLLLATTSELSQDVAAVPLIWVVPFALYLLTYIVAFAGWYSRGFWAASLVLSASAALWSLQPGTGVHLAVQAAFLLTAFVAACMVCHGELVRVQPPASRLTVYYLAIAIGGSLGGLFVAMLAPVVFSDYFELPLLLLLACTLVAFAAIRDYQGRHREDLTTLASAGATAAFGVAALLIVMSQSMDGEFARQRSVYGVLRVVQDAPKGAHAHRRLYHGRILHGSQYLEPGRALTPTSYYAEGSGIDIALARHPKRLAGQPLSIGAIGLGTGTIAALGRTGDRLRFYEIDPLVVDFARRYFTYLDRTPATVDIAMGDARLTLEREVADADRRRHDVLAIDAFSGDAIPVHLLTRESFAIYREALAPDGVLAVHISNRYLDLRPVVYGLADEVGWGVVQAIRQADLAGSTFSNWLLVTANRALLADLGGAAQRDAGAPAGFVWTDSFSSLLTVVKR